MLSFASYAQVYSTKQLISAFLLPEHIKILNLRNIYIKIRMAEAQKRTDGESVNGTDEGAQSMLVEQNDNQPGHTECESQQNTPAEQLASDSDAEEEAGQSDSDFERCTCIDCELAFWNRKAHISNKEESKRDNVPYWHMDLDECFADEPACENCGRCGRCKVQMGACMFYMKLTMMFQSFATGEDSSEPEFKAFLIRLLNEKPEMFIDPMKILTALFAKFGRAFADFLDEL